MQILRVLLSYCTFAIVAAAAHSAAVGADGVSEKQAAVKAFRGLSTNLQFNRDGSVRLIRFSKRVVTDAALEKLKPFKRIDYLAVVCPQITDAGIAHIAGLTNLDTLLLSDSGISDAGLKSLRKLVKLEQLDLSNTKITDAGLAHLTGLKKLKTLSLEQTAVTDRGLAQLKLLPYLEVLILANTKITDAGLAQLKGLTKLRVLSLAGCRIDGNGLAWLKQLKKLEHLTLTDTAIRDASLKHLRGMRGLKDVVLFRTGVTQAVISELRRGLSKTRFHLSPGVATGKTDGRHPLNGQAARAGRKPALKIRPVLSSVRQRLARGKRETPDFQRHVIPLLSRLGCNGRSCHGSFQGQGGFRLSLFGYDFARDHKNLSARVNRHSPAKSLIVNKPTSAEEHEGGLRFKPGGWEQKLLTRWVAGGAKTVASGSPTFVRLDVQPREIVFRKANETVRLKAVAVWSDGTREDVTCLTRFTSKDDSVADVSPDGLIRPQGKGDTHVIAYYDNGIVPTPVIVPTTQLNGDRYPPVATPTAIDKHVVAKLKKLGIRPSALCSDEEFLRRVSLDMIGTLPTPAEIRAFVKDRSADKRPRKIDELLERPAYVVWWTTRLCDLTGSNAGYLGGTEMAQPVAAQWRAWIRRRVEKNVGWDQIVQGIVLARSRRLGQPYREFIAEQSAFTRRSKPADFAALGNPMPHFWFRSNLVKPAEKALAFGHTFLGIRLDCAQCHKHPFDQWSKRDFEQFTEFFTRIKAGIAPDAVEPQKRMQRILGVPVKLNTAALRRQSYLRIASEGRPIPWKEVYIIPPRAKPHLAKLLGGQTVELNRYADPRTPLMSWLLNEPNHYLAKAFVNRMWANYFNVGIVHPPDDLNRANPPSNRALLDGLVSGFLKSGYDMKWLHRTIANSHTYQRSWRPNESNRTDERNFSRAVLRRLPAEVVIDAVIQATANSKTLSQSKFVVKKRKIGQHPKSFQTRSIDFSLLIFGKPLRTTNCDCERQGEPTLLQSLYLRNDQESIDRLDRRDGWLAELKKQKLDRSRVNELIETAYLRLLSRLPEKTELADCRLHIRKSKSLIDGLRDVIWALLNTQEFITNH